MAGLSIEVEMGRDVERRFNRLPQKVQDAAGVRALTAAAILLSRSIKASKLSGNPLHVRTGRLRSSIRYRVNKEGGDLVARVGTNVKYARVHEFGGVVRPKKAQFLTIPLAAAKTPRGVARFTARQLIARPGIGGFTGTFFHERTLFGKTAAGGAVPLFRLKRSVRIPERRYLRSALKENRDAIISGMVVEIQKELAKP